MWKLLIPSVLACASCSHTTNKLTENQEPEKIVAPFPLSSPLKDFQPTTITGWENVLPDQKSFLSPGHENERVRVYFDSRAKNGYASKTKPVRFPPGSLIAKAFVADEKQPTLQARSIYFMRKHATGYFPKGNDWEYGVAEKNSEGIYEWKGTGKIAACRPCHAAYPDHDFVFTVERHQKHQSAMGRIKLWLEGLL